MKQNKPTFNKQYLSHEINWATQNSKKGRMWPAGRSLPMADIEQLNSGILLRLKFLITSYL